MKKIKSPKHQIVPFGLTIMRRIVPSVALILLVAATAFSTNVPKSGALLEIDGTVNATDSTSAPVHLKVYDSQIPTGYVQVPSTSTAGPFIEPSTCTSAAGDEIPTDAYILQAGAPTGCDPGSLGEASLTRYAGSVNISAASQTGSNTTYTYTVSVLPDLNPGYVIVITGMTDPGNNGTFIITSVVPPGVDFPGTFTVMNANGVTTTTAQAGTGKGVANTTGMFRFVSPAGSPVAYEFDITTKYVCGPLGEGISCTAPLTCNHDDTVCSTDSGFLTVTNNAAAGSTFIGTIKLSGQPGNPSGCTPDPVTLTDTVTNGLTPGASTVLALSNDASACGGFNAPQTQTLVAGTTNIFPFGKDDYQFTPVDSQSGDQLTFLPVPIPAGPLGLNSWGAGNFGPEHAPENPVFPSPLRFSATNFPSQACIPYADFSALNNPVCVEIQLDCVNGETACADEGTFFYTSQVDYSIDKNSLPKGVGGPQFLGDHADECPTQNFNIDTFFSYTATTPVSGDPTKGQGRGNSCFATTFDPTKKAVAAGNTVTQHTFIGFFPPVLNEDRRRDRRDNDDPSSGETLNEVEPGETVPLIWQTKDTSGHAVNDLELCTDPTGVTCSTNPPSVFVGFETIDCASDASLSGLMSAASNSGLRNLGEGMHEFLWKTPKPATGCVSPVLVFSTGFVALDVAEFIFEN
jgi:hypothetical protein